MEDLVIYQKSYDCLLYMYAVLRGFPKSEKFALASDIKNGMIDFMSLLVKAQKSNTKRNVLYEADIKLVILKTHIRLATDLKYITLRRNGILTQKLGEIGKLLGGWIKVSKQG